MVGSSQGYSTIGIISFREISRPQLFCTSRYVWPNVSTYRLSCLFSRIHVAADVCVFISRQQKGLERPNLAELQSIVCSVAHHKNFATSHQGRGKGRPKVGPKCQNSTLVTFFVGPCTVWGAPFPKFLAPVCSPLGVVQCR